MSEGIEQQIENLEKVIELKDKEIKTLIDKDSCYKAYESEIASLKGNLLGLERIVSFMMSPEQEGSTIKHNAKILWQSYLNSKSKKELELMGELGVKV